MTRVTGLVLTLLAGALVVDLAVDRYRRVVRRSMRSRPDRAAHERLMQELRRHHG